MRRALCLLIAIAACADTRVPSVVTPPPVHPRAANQLRVMTYNVNFGMAGDASTMAAIAAVQPDIVLLQETNERWEAQLVYQFSSRFPYHHFDVPANGIGGGMGLMSRYAIADVQKLTTPQAPFFALRSLIDTPLGRIQVFNLHLHPPVSDGGSWVVGFFSTRNRRGREILYHLEALDPTLPALFVGDFNEDANGKAVAALAERGFTDAVSQFHGGKRTWQWKLETGQMLRFQLDHVMYDAHFVPVACQIVEAGRSDHKPVFVDFERIDP